MEITKKILDFGRYFIPFYGFFDKGITNYQLIGSTINILGSVLLTAYYMIACFSTESINPITQLKVFQKNYITSQRKEELVNKLCYSIGTNHDQKCSLEELINFYKKAKINTAKINTAKINTAKINTNTYDLSIDKLKTILRSLSEYDFKKGILIQSEKQEKNKPKSKDIGVNKQ